MTMTGAERARALRERRRRGLRKLSVDMLFTQVGGLRKTLWKQRGRRAPAENTRHQRHDCEGRRSRERHAPRALEKSRAKIGMLGGACDVAEGAH